MGVGASSAVAAEGAGERSPVYTVHRQFSGGGSARGGLSPRPRMSTATVGPTTRRATVGLVNKEWTEAALLFTHSAAAAGALSRRDYHAGAGAGVGSVNGGVGVSGTEQEVPRLTPHSAARYVRRRRAFAFPAAVRTTIDLRPAPVVGAPGDFIVVDGAAMSVVPAAEFRKAYTRVKGSEHQYAASVSVLALRVEAPTAWRVDADGPPLYAAPGQFLVQEVRSGKAYVVDAIVFVDTFTRESRAPPLRRPATSAPSDDLGATPAIDELGATPGVTPGAPSWGALPPGAAPSGANAQLDAADAQLDALEDYALFDVFALATAAASPLAAVLARAAALHGLCGRLRVRAGALTAFALRLEAEYLDNPYHNALHAVDVMQGLVVLLATRGVAASMEPVEIFAGLLAAAAHDVGHPGRTNAFLVRGGNSLARAHNDRSPLEHFHAATLFKVADAPDADVLAGLSADQCVPCQHYRPPQRVTRGCVCRYSTFRRLAIELILSTDLARHAEEGREFAATCAAAAAAAAGARGGAGAGGAAVPGDSLAHAAPAPPPPALPPRLPSKRLFGHSLVHPGVLVGGGEQVGPAARAMLLRQALRCADVGHPARPLARHLRWTGMLMEEFAGQAADEAVRARLLRRGVSVTSARWRACYILC